MAVKETKGKPRVELVHYAMIKAIAEVREFGNNKYHNDEDWKQNPPKDYIAAAIRHLYKYLWEGEVDEESGLSHLAHAATSLDLAITLIELEKNKPTEKELAMKINIRNSLIKEGFTFTEEEGNK